MKQLSCLILVSMMIVLGATRAQAAPDDPFAKADATVAMCSGIFPIVALLIMVGFMIIVLAKRRQDKRNK